MTADEGDGDEWPQLRTQVLDAEVFVLATPIWLGHPSSYAQRVLERLDAFLGEQDDRDQSRPWIGSQSSRSSATRTVRTTSAPSCSRA